MTPLAIRLSRAGAAGDGRMTGWYYLHQNGELVYKRELGGTAADLRESNLVVAMWPFDGTMAAAARIVVEASVAGASAARVQELATLWGLGDANLTRYAQSIGIGVDIDGGQWCAMPPGFTNLAESPAGFGDTVREAIVDLARAIGFMPQKLWGESLKDALLAVVQGATP